MDHVTETRRIGLHLVLLFCAICAVSCGKKVQVHSSPSESVEPAVQSAAPSHEEPDPGLIIRDALRSLLAGAQPDRERAIELLLQLSTADSSEPHRDQAVLILELVKKLEGLEEDLQGREATVLELSKELETLKEIILRERAVRPPE